MSAASLPETETFGLFQLLFIIKKKTFLSLICKIVLLTLISNEIQHFCTFWFFLNTLEQNLSPLTARPSAFGRKHHRLMVLNPSRKLDIVLTYTSGTIELIYDREAKCLASNVTKTEYRDMTFTVNYENELNKFELNNKRKGWLLNGYGPFTY